MRVRVVPRWGCLSWHRLQPHEVLSTFMTALAEESKVSWQGLRKIEALRRRPKALKARPSIIKSLKAIKQAEPSAILTLMDLELRHPLAITSKAILEFVSLFGKLLGSLAQPPGLEQCCILSYLARWCGIGPSAWTLHAVACCSNFIDIAAAATIATTPTSTTNTAFLGMAFGSRR